MENLIVYKGKDSQTGIAFKKEFDITNSKDSITLSGREVSVTSLSFEDIRDILKDDSYIALLPIWNSHEGEIEISFSLRMLFEDNIKLLHLWPKDIFFECIINNDEVVEKNVLSVEVAQQQCSKFLDRSDLNFEKAKSTVDAYNRFKNDPGKYHAVLIPPEMNKDGFSVLESHAENPLNFTTFSLLGSNHDESTFNVEWHELRNKVFPGNVYFSGIQMPLGTNFTENQNALFDQFLLEADSVESIPKAIFVADHNDSSECRIIFEVSNEKMSLHEILDSDGLDESILVLDDVGSMANSYSKRVMEHLYSKDLVGSNDFVKHVGTDACFFACPALGILTHGFSEETTEAIVKRMIEKCLELLVRQDFSPKQGTILSNFFDKYKDSYKASSTEFIEFQSL